MSSCSASAPPMSSAARFPVSPPPLARAGYNHDKIRLAYISSDVSHHPVASQVVQLIESHDREKFEVIGIRHQCG